MSSIAVPDAVRRKALACGAEGERWLDQLPGVVSELAMEWAVEVGEAMVGGSASYVIRAVTADGAPVVLKLAMPEGLEGQGAFARELRTLVIGAGRGYVRVLRADEARRAMLLERLGRPLSGLGLPVPSQIEIIVSTLRRSWRPVPEGHVLRTGADQAQFLAQFIQARWDELDRPCPRNTIDRAIRCACSRRKAFDRSTSVLVHGDAHPANVLQDLGEPDRFKLVDPDGMVSEPAHDLGIPLRDWSEELLAGDAAALALDWCAQAADLAGATGRAIWEWAFVERVSTGLFLTQLGDRRGALLLEVANRLATSEPAAS